MGGGCMDDPCAYPCGICDCCQLGARLGSSSYEPCRLRKLSSIPIQCELAANGWGHRPRRVSRARLGDCFSRGGSRGCRETQLERTVCVGNLQLFHTPWRTTHRRTRLARVCTATAPIAFPSRRGERSSGHIVGCMAPAFLFVSWLEPMPSSDLFPGADCAFDPDDVCHEFGSIRCHSANCHARRFQYFGPILSRSFCPDKPWRWRVIEQSLSSDSNGRTLAALYPHIYLYIACHWGMERRHIAHCIHKRQTWIFLGIGFIVFSPQHCGQQRA